MADAILVTGATGLIGTPLVRQLRAAGHHVVTLSTTDGDISEAMPPVPPVRHVFHLAAKTFVPDSWTHPAGFYRVNVMGTVNVLDYCRRHNVAFTLVSSYVYANPPVNPISEDHPVRAINPYSHSKLTAEQVAGYYASAFQLPVTVVRPFNIYGPGQRPHFLIPKLIEQVISEAPVLTVEDVRPKRDYLFVDDLCGLLIRLMEAGSTGTFNAGSGSSFSVAEIAHMINQAAGTSKPVVSRENYRPGEVLDVVADVSKVRREVGWEPSVSLQQGLRVTLDAARIEVAHGQYT